MDEGIASTQTTALCLLLDGGKSGEIRIVTGIWRSGESPAGHFGHSIPTSKPFFANVRPL
jgi:hypothetical protein